MNKSIEKDCREFYAECKNRFDLGTEEEFIEIMRKLFDTRFDYIAIVDAHRNNRGYVWDEEELKIAEEFQKTQEKYGDFDMKFDDWDRERGLRKGREKKLSEGYLF